MNFSKNLFSTHKNDYIFYSTNTNGQTVEVYVTKLYKLVKLIDESEYILDLEDFISLMISSICKKNISRKFKLKHIFNIIYKRKSFQIFYKKNIIFNSTYEKSFEILKSINPLFYSFIINQKVIKHIDDKKSFILNLSSNILDYSNLKDNFYNFLSKIDQNIDCFFIHEMNSKWFILILSSYIFIKHF